MSADYACFSWSEIRTAISGFSPHDFLLEACLWAAVTVESWLMCITNSCHLPTSAFWKTSMHSSVVAQAAAAGGSPNRHPTVTVWKWTGGGSALHPIPKMCIGKVWNNSSHNMCSMLIIWHMAFIILVPIGLGNNSILSLTDLVESHGFIVLQNSDGQWMIPIKLLLNK